MVDSISAVYEVELTDVTGQRVALFDDWRGLTIKRNLNGIDAVSFVIYDGDSRVSLFELDGQVRVYRYAPYIENSEKYIEAECFHRSFLRQTLENGNKQYTSFSRGYNDLLFRRIIGYKSGTIRAEKNAPAETCMKEFVYENAGAGATVPLGRLINGVIPNFNVESDAANGANWSGARAYNNLLEVLQEIANESSIDFNVNRIGDASWLFSTYLNQLGEDRTTEGLDTDTGLNAAGNPPVVFSIPQGTVQEITHSESRTEEVNVVFALGRGEGSTRHVEIRTDPLAIDDSPMNHREVSRNGSANEYIYQLQDFGDGWLTELAAKEEFSFSPLQQPSLMYGVHYNFGDRVTARYGDVERHKRIVGVDITVEGEDKKEIITFDFADIP